VPRTGLDIPVGALAGAACDSTQAAKARLAHIARGTLPNIAPPSSFCELPRIDQSFMS
jgi:hypothetical protein